MKPYKLITTDDPTKTLGEGRMRHYKTLVDAASAFAQAPEPYKNVLYDDGHVARELTTREQGLVERVCDMLGYDVEDVPEW